MGTPNGMGYVALYCVGGIFTTLLVFLAVIAVKEYRTGDKKLALLAAIVFLFLFILIAAAVWKLFSE